jgi:DNA polymerase-3 subunit alpha
VNLSGLDFTIEEQAGDALAIRFGMGAIKNVGEGPVQVILDARETRGPFRDLDGFCRRVDMRQVNRRALESLIKVGALRDFGTRSQLLPVVERIIGLSATVHRARDVGQMSLFGEGTGVHLDAKEAMLPSLSRVPEVPQKEILAWEKELVGVYVSEHPLTQTLIELQDVVTGYAGALGSDNHGQTLTVVGMVQRVRRHTTKKGDEMAFVTLEDLQGTCDVVVFPKVWANTKNVWQPERILVVGGKVEAGRRDTPSLLCSWVKTPDAVVVPGGEDMVRVHGSAPGSGSRGSRPIVREQVKSPPAPKHTVRVTLTRSGKQAQDVERLHSIHSLLVGHSGEDRFVIRLVGGTSKPVELAFPNDRTHYGPALMRELSAVVGPEGVHVEATR